MYDQLYVAAVVDVAQLYLTRRHRDEGDNQTRVLIQPDRRWHDFNRVQNVGHNPRPAQLEAELEFCNKSEAMIRLDFSRSKSYLICII